MGKKSNKITWELIRAFTEFADSLERAGKKTTCRKARHVRLGRRKKG